MRLRQSVNPPGAEYRFDHQEIAQFVAETNMSLFRIRLGSCFLSKHTLDDTNQDRLPFRAVTMIYVGCNDWKCCRCAVDILTTSSARADYSLPDPYLRVHLTFSMLIAAFPCYFSDEIFLVLAESCVCRFEEPIATFCPQTERSVVLISTYECLFIPFATLLDGDG